MKLLILLSFALAGSAYALDCDIAGPQTPRDITSALGSNKSHFSLAPPADEMNLCNIHFHKNAEHKGPEFSKFAGKGVYGGYQCQKASQLSPGELAKPAKKICKNIQPGDTVEFHWVHTSCNIKPGEGLGSCSSPSCANPQLRVETQVFVLVNDSDALQMQTFDLGSSKSNNKFQANAIPDGGTPVTFLGSTTGPSFDSGTKCSPLQVTWSVRPTCQKMDINSLHKWCEDNAFNEVKAHGVRELVTNPDYLSPIN